MNSYLGFVLIQILALLFGLLIGTILKKLDNIEKMLKELTGKSEPEKLPYWEQMKIKYGYKKAEDKWTKSRQQ